MTFSDLRRASHEYQLMTIKRLVGGVEVMQGFLANAHMDPCTPRYL